MILKQYYLGCLAHASYLVGDEQSGKAAIIDPQRDVDQYFADAEALGLKIEYVFLTHFHADFVAGHVELRNRTGARIYLGAQALAEYEFVPVQDGDVVQFGQTALKVLETPGHTPEGISLLAYDLAQDPGRPQAVFTGDTLFIGDVGRPDLMASIGVSAEELGGMLYDSLHQKLLALPDDTLLYPAHGAGSMCGKKLSSESVSTIGMQRKHNYALQPMSKAEFIRLVTADQPEAPAYFLHDAMLNRQERASLDESLQQSLRALTLEETLQLQSAGAQVVDVRSGAEFAAGHLRDSVNIGLRGNYATWAGTVLDRENPIVLIAEAGDEQEAAMRLGRIGFDHVAGYLQGGMQALAAHPELLRSAEQVTVDGLAVELACEMPPLVLDVRAPKERETGSLRDSVHIPLNRLADRLDELPRDRRLIVHCAGGYRSAIAVSLLKQAGFENVADLAGGYAAWEKDQPRESACS